jgi:preprotein translocase subunit YajC
MLDEIGSSLMFISPAFAQDGTSPFGGDIFGMLLPLVLIMVVFWFLLIRPQQKRVKEHQEMVKNVRRGDMVVTSGGIIGKISKVVDDNEVVIEVADNLRMRLQRNAISEVRVKGEPAKDEPKK